jgi:hypothetical protein
MLNKQNYIILILIVILLIIYLNQGKEHFEIVEEEYIRNSYQPKLYCEVNSTYQDNKCYTKTCDENLSYDSTLNKCLVKQENVQTTPKFLFFPCGNTEVNGMCYTKPNNYICGNQVDQEKKVQCWYNTVEPKNYSALKICSEDQVLEEGLCYDKPKINYVCDKNICRKDVSVSGTGERIYTTEPQVTDTTGTAVATPAPAYTPPKIVGDVVVLNSCEEIIFLTYNKINDINQNLNNFSFKNNNGKLDIINLTSLMNNSETNSILKFKLCNPLFDQTNENKFITLNNNLVGIDNYFNILYMPFDTSIDKVGTFQSNLLVYNISLKKIYLYSNDIYSPNTKFISINNNTIQFTDITKANIFQNPNTSLFKTGDVYDINKIKDYVNKM